MSDSLPGDSLPGDSLLQTRAARLAQRPQAQESDSGAVEVVEFVLAGEKYAVESDLVREVHAPRHWTPVPCTPAFVLGIINVRSQILTVLDIRRFFELPSEEWSGDSRVIIVRSRKERSREMGILADDVLGVCVLRREEIAAPPSGLSGLRAEYLQGVVSREAGHWLAVLDVAKILDDERIVVREEVVP